MPVGRLGVIRPHPEAVRHERQQMWRCGRSTIDPGVKENQVVEFILPQLRPVEVGRRDPMALIGIYKDLRLGGIDAIVLSSCVQMPSLAAVPVVEDECGLPVVSASICTTHQMLQKLGLKTFTPNAGSLLSGKF